MKWISNLPDSNHTPFPVIKAEPHPREIVRYFRPSDYAAVAAWGVLAPGFFYAWEKSRPSLHPRLLPKVLAIQAVFYSGVGLLWAGQSSIFRFWGWSENAREQAMYKKELEAGIVAEPQEPNVFKPTWSKVDWK